MNQAAWPRITGFRVLKALGRGAASRVFLAEQEGTERCVALKVVTCAEGVAAERLAREARILASLDHPGLVRVYAAGSDGPLCWIALEHVRGGSLEDLLADGPLPWSRAREIWVGVLEALAEMHRRGMVHRDVKPANILMDESGRPRLADFGLARAASDPGLTSHGGTLGTPLFMAPEQIHAPSLAGPRADVFSAALVLFAMLHGKSPFAAETVPEVLQRVLNQPLPELPRDAARPHALDDLLAEATAKDPARRPADAGVLLKRLGDLESGRRARWMILRRATLAAAVLLLVSGVALLWPRASVVEPVPSPVAAPPAPVSTAQVVAEVWPGKDATLADWLAAERRQQTDGAPGPVVHPGRAAMIELAVRELELLQRAEFSPGSFEQLSAAWPEWLSTNESVRPRLSEARARVAAEALLRRAEAAARRTQILGAVEAAGAGRFWSRVAADQHLKAEFSKAGIAAVPDVEREAWAAACDATVSALVQAGERRLADTLDKVRSFSSGGKFVQAMQMLEGLREAAHLPGASETIERQREAVRSEDQRRFDLMESTRAGVVHALALRRRGDAFNAVRGALECALSSAATEPLDAARAELALERGSLLLAGVNLETTLYRDAMLSAPGAIGRALPLRLHGEAARGQRRLVGVSEDSLEWEREADGFRSRVKLNAMDATTLLAIAGKQTEKHAALAVVIARLNCGDAVGLADCTLLKLRETEELLAAIEGVRRANASSALERDAWDVLARVRSAVALGDMVGADSALARVAALRERAARPVPPGWREIHAEESGWERFLVVAGRQQKFAVREGWLLQRDMDAAAWVATPGPDLRCGKARMNEGGILVPAGMQEGEALALQLPEGAFKLSWSLECEPAMLVGSAGERSFVVVLRESVEAARAEPLHGLERGLLGWRRVDRALAFDGPLSEWHARWNSSRSFPREASTRWLLSRDAKGQLTLERGAARLDFGLQAAASRFGLQAPEPLQLGALQLELRDRQE